MAGIASASVLHRTGQRERRIKPRKSVLDLCLVPVQMDPAGFGLMLDVSETGLGVQVMSKLKPGTDVKLSFDLPYSSRRVEGDGVVKWYDEHGRVGIEFVKTHDVLNRWVASLPKKDDNPEESASSHPVFTEQAQAVREQIASKLMDLDLVLQHLIEKIVEMTGSNGGAVALGHGENMVCRASTGLAPDVGVHIDPSSALTSECIRTGKIVRCDDTETDSRVDPEVCRQLNLRSSLILPVLADGEVKGVLEVFSPIAHAFNEKHFSLLKQLADFTSEVINGTDFLKNEPLIQPQATVAQEAAAPVQAMPFISALLTDEEVKAVEVPPEKSAQAAVEDATSESLGDVPAPKATIEDFIAQLDEKPSRDLRMIPVIAMAVLFLIVAAVWFMTSRAQRTLPQATAQPITAVPPVQNPPAQQTVIQQQPIPLPVDSLPMHEPKKTPGHEQGVDEPHVIAEDTVKSTVPELPRAVSPAATALKNSEVQVEAPSVVGLGTAANLNSVPLPGIVTVPKLQTATGVTGGLLLHRVEPEYPMMAKKMGLDGDVQLSAHVNKNGHVENVKRVSGSSVLSSAAIRAVRQWRYEPYRLNGQPQDVDITINIHFRLPK